MVDDASLVAVLLVVAGILGNSHLAAASAAERPARVEDILELEGINRIVFTPDSRRVLYEWIAPYASVPNTASYLGDLDQSVLAKIYEVQTEGAAHGVPAFSQREAASYWLGNFSPDGERLAIYELEKGRLRAGVLQLSNKAVQWFDFVPNYSEDVRRPIWTSNDQLIYATVDPRDPLAGQGKRGYALAIQAQWQRAFDGNQASVTELVSDRGGVAAVDQFRPGRLVVAYARTGRSREVAKGYFHGMRLSPGNRYLAALREAGPVQPATDDGIDTYAYGPDPNRHALVVLDLAGMSMRTPCAECDVLLGSPNWSYDGSRLIFLAKGKADPISRTRLYQYVPDSGAITEVDTHGVRLTCGALFAPGRIHVATLGAMPVVFGYEDAETSSDGILDCGSVIKVEPGILDTRESRRNDWFLLSPDGAVNLTAALQHVHGELLGQSRDAVLVLDDAAGWRIEATGDRHRVFTRLDNSPLTPISGQEILTSYWRDIDGSNGYALPRNSALLLARDHVVTIDVKTGKSKTLPVTNARETFRASALTSDRIIVQEYSSAASSRISVIERGRRKRTLVTLNQDTSIGSARQVRVDFLGPNGGKLQSCLMLPSGWTAARRYPGVVVTYADTDGSCWSDGRVRPARLGAIDTEVLAAHGFVVIHTAEPASEVRGAQGRTENLTAVVLRAVDAAVSAGYVDADRVGIIGISQGMHNALQVATETDRFKAVVAGFGVSNTASYYNALFLRCRLGHCSPGAASRYEHPLSPNYLGAKPWEAPQLYVRSSPVFQADRIRASVLLFASDFDVSPNQSEEMFTALYRQRKEAALAFYWGEEHGVFGAANMRDYWKRILGWFDRHLKDESAGEPPHASNSGRYGLGLNGATTSQ